MHEGWVVSGHCHPDLMLMLDAFASAVDWDRDTQVGALTVTAGVWLAILGIGPLRVLGVAAQGNIAVVGFRHMPGKLRREKWEIWLALPLFAYVASVSSGFVTGLYLDGGLVAQLVGATLFALTLPAIMFAGVFLGLQDDSVDIENVTDPGAFRADIAAMDKSGNVSPEMVAKARSHLDRLMLEQARPWLKSFENDLVGVYALTSQPGPARGVGTWRDSAGNRITVKARFVAKHALKRKALLCGPVAGLAFSSMLVGLMTYQLLHPNVGWSTPALGMSASITVLLSILVTYMAARADMIYKVRLRAAEHEHKRAAELMIYQWERRLNKSAGVMPLVHSPMWRLRQTMWGWWRRNGAYQAATPID